MEKVAILTHCVANNFGANLQALSTAYYLKNHGYKPVFLQWSAYLDNDLCSDQESIHRNFLKKCGFELSKPLQTDNDFSDYIEKEGIKRIVVGSDCVLTYEHHTIPYRLTRKGFVRIKQSEDYKFPNPFWLPFLKNPSSIKKCLMSASCGGGTKMKIKEKTVKQSMKELLGNFDFISVRDTFTKKFVQEMLPERNEILLTPDPVFGFNKNVDKVPTEAEIRDKFRIEGKYYIISFYSFNWPNQKWANSIMREAHKHKTKCVSVMMPQGGRNSSYDIDIELPLDPLEWYALIKYSNGYIGNNMHPLIVAVHNNVPFFSYNIHGRSLLRGRIQLIKTSKEYDLLSRFGLHKNIVPQPFIHFISPKRVIKDLNSFDIEACRRASAFLQKEYDIMMANIMETLK